MQCAVKKCLNLFTQLLFPNESNLGYSLNAKRNEGATPSQDAHALTSYNNDSTTASQLFLSNDYSFIGFLMAAW